MDLDIYYVIKRTQFVGNDVEKNEFVLINAVIKVIINL